MTFRNVFLTLRCLSVVTLFLLFSVPSRPQFDEREVVRAYEKYPLMPVSQIRDQTPSIEAAVKKGPQAYRPTVRKLDMLADACSRLEYQADKLSAEDYGMLRPVCSVVESNKRMVSHVFYQTFGTKAIADAVNAEPPTPSEITKVNSRGPEALRSVQLFWLTWHFWLWSFWFTPLVIALRCEQLGKSFWYELQYRPHKVIGTWLFPPALLGYPNDNLYQHVVKSVRWVLKLATSALSFALTFGGWAITAGVAKAQANGGKKNQPITWLLDYRRTDKVAGDGPGGLPNTLFVQVENAPKLPKRLVLESISAFGDKGYQTDAFVAVKAFSLSRLKIWPAAGVQFNTNGSRGFVYGTQMSYKRGRLAVAVPNVWFERLVTPKPVNTFWVIARPLYNVRGALSLCGEVNYKKSGQSPGVTTLGIGLDIKARFLRIKAIALWKSDGAWLMRKQAVASGTL